MIALLAESGYQEFWGSPLSSLYVLLSFGGLIVVTVSILISVMRWFWSGDFKFWWNYERHIWVQKPRD